MGIGKKLKQLRVREGMTQEALAKRIGVTPSAVGNYEHEFSFPKEEVLMKLFGALSCSPNELFGESDIFGAEERAHLEKYSALDIHGREVVDTVMGIELKRIGEAGKPADENAPEGYARSTAPAGECGVSDDGVLIAARKGSQRRIRFRDPDTRLSDLPEYKGGRK